MHRRALWGWLGWLALTGCQCGGAPDAAEDAGAPDAGPTDAGAPDAGPTDAGAPDAGPTDAGAPDAGPTDAGAPDACAAVTWPAPPGCTATTLQGKLACVPGLQVQAAAPLGGRTRYSLSLTQLVDHGDADAGTFEQRAMLLLGDDGAPTVLSTTGYELWPYLEELTWAFGAHQLTYEHRYFASSRPVPTDWSHLTIAQAASDAHAWAQALRWLLPGPWVSTGGSKGGMTSVYHRRFFPCDVEATVAYVAPVTYGTRDDGYSAFLAQVGGAGAAWCRDELTQFQRRLLSARGRLVPQVTGAFTRIGGADVAFELAVVELPFAFWQYTSPDDLSFGCAGIPPAGASDAAMLDFLDSHSPVDVLAGDQALLTFEAYYYQAATQLGAPSPYEAPLAGLLSYPGADVAETYAPPGVPLAFDPAAMLDVNGWIDQHGERLLLVYGELDPWSTHELPLGGARDSFRYVVPAGNHSARLGLLPAPDKEEALLTLERWLGQRRVLTPQVLHAAPPTRRVPR